MFFYCRSRLLKKRRNCVLIEYRVLHAFRSIESGNDREKKREREKKEASDGCARDSEREEHAKESPYGRFVWTRFTLRVRWKSALDRVATSRFKDSSLLRIPPSPLSLRSLSPSPDTVPKPAILDESIASRDSSIIHRFHRDPIVRLLTPSFDSDSLGSIKDHLPRNYARRTACNGSN